MTKAVHRDSLAVEAGFLKALWNPRPTTFRYEIGRSPRLDGKTQASSRHRSGLFGKEVHEPGWNRDSAYGRSRLRRCQAPLAAPGVLYIDHRTQEVNILDVQCERLADS